MQDNSTFNTVQHLRKILGKTQEDFALLVGVSRNAIALIETGRLGLSSKLAERISRETGVAVLWLTANDPSFPMVDFNGQLYRAERFSEAQEIARSRDLRPLALHRDEPEMEICVAAGLLVHLLEAARQKNQVSQLQKRLERFVQSELAHFPELRDEVYQELREWNERYVGTGRTFPKTFLFPRDPALFERLRQLLERAPEWIAEWEKQVPPRKR
jgi:transcriptional regulator with XRE-family HTH domain